MAKTNIQGTKFMLCIWWDLLGLVYYGLLQPNENTTGERYQQQLMEFSRVFKQKRPDFATRQNSQHDNARPHVTETLEELNWDVLPHPPYSTDIAPSD
ncbi:Mariner Mos1 transposase [Araneus ventricosus]|uniref:Mariner Mos1 transposase n=1 Tax=Araneus ventricosus TaxID=182803 RepID=A0A4Y2BSD8_ARAVE|nr:Mariner Mos1 transposase [Araneus ventricosus]